MGIDYQSEVKRKLEEAAGEDRDERNQRVWRDAITKFAFASHEANFSLIRDWCSGELSMAKIDWLLGPNKPASGFDLDWTDEKPNLINAILAARQWPNPANERKRFQLRTRVQLLDELALMVSKEELSKYTAAELKAGLAEHRAKESSWYFDSKGMRWPRLPSVIVPPGFVSAIQTSNYLRHAAKNNVFTLRHFVSKYGLEQVDTFLNN